MVSSGAPVFLLLSKYNPEHHYLISLSLRHCDPNTAYTLLHFNSLRKASTGPQELADFIFIKLDAVEQVVQFITEVLPCRICS